MSDDLVKRLRGLAVHSYLGRSVIEEAADRIEQLTAERDGLLRCVTDNHVALCRAEAAEAERDHAWAMVAKADTQMGQSLADNLQAKAERDRLREALNQSRLAFAGHVSVQSAIDLIDRAALKGESHE